MRHLLHDDFTGDGVLDLLVTNFGSANDLLVGDGAGGFALAAGAAQAGDLLTVQFSSTLSTCAAVSDFDGDGVGQRCKLNPGLKKAPHPVFKV